MSGISEQWPIEDEFVTVVMTDGKEVKLPLFGYLEYDDGYAECHYAVDAASLTGVEDDIISIFSKEKTISRRDQSYGPKAIDIWEIVNMDRAFEIVTGSKYKQAELEKWYQEHKGEPLRVRQQLDLGLGESKLLESLVKTSERVFRRN